MIGDRDRGVDRAHVDDGAGALAGLHLRDHAPRGRLADEKRALKVHPQHAVEIGFGQIEEVGAVDDAGVVDQDVEIANHTPYCVSKGGIDQLTKVMALALAPYGIRVNAIGPGSIMTDILKAAATDKEAKRRILARTPLGRIGAPDEIASIAVFLASEEASYITGETIYADGGRLALNYTVPVEDKALE